MFFTTMTRSIRQRPVRVVWKTATRVAVTTLLLIAPQVAFAQTAADFEKPPVLKVTQLIPAKLLTGQGFHVAEMVPTDGVMGTYTINADKKTFGADAGTYQVRSRELLEIRLEEIPAIIKLDETSKTGVFAKSMATTAVRPLEATGQMVLHPVDTVTGLPSGVGRLFERIDTGASSLWSSDTNSNESGLERTGNAVEQVGSIAVDALGYEKVRRDLAKKLGVDPYTTNPILAKKLDEIARVAFYAHVGVNMAISVAVPASIIITGVTTIDNLVWDTTRGDLIVRVENKLEELQVPKKQIHTFMHNAAIPLSLQVAVVENLGRLSGVSGRGTVVALLGQVPMESQARFLSTSLRMLAEYHEKKKPITDMGAPGPLVARDQDGAIIMPTPVDYLSWTERVARFATQPAFLSVPQRTLWLAGQMSPRAKEGFVANGWNVHASTEP